MIPHVRRSVIIAKKGENFLAPIGALVSMFPGVQAVCPACFVHGTVLCTAIIICNVLQ